jgi:hypothetical protein
VKNLVIYCLIEFLISFETDQPQSVNYSTSKTFVVGTETSVLIQHPQTVHRQNVEVTNAEWTQRRTTKRRMGHNAECQNVE